MKPLLNPEYNLYEKDGQPYCDSLQIAETFEKRHADVLNTIGKILAPESGLSREFTERNFSLSKYKDGSGKSNPKYLLTKDGFTIVTFGYTGKKAMAFKEACITRFNQMERFIKSLLNTKLEFPDFTDAVMLAHDEPKNYHFSNEINMIYRIILGMDARQFREANGLEKGIVIKPYLTLEQIRAVESLQRADIGLIEAGLDFEQRKEKLTGRYQRELLKISA